MVPEYYTIITGIYNYSVVDNRPAFINCNNISEQSKEGKKKVVPPSEKLKTPSIK